MLYFFYMQNPLISVIIPTFNRAKMVCDCVRSVLATDYPALEVIVVDDCSTEDVNGELMRTVASPAVTCVRTPKNLMVAGARNLGARKASGDYLVFLDNDNVVHPDIFIELLKVFREQQNVGLVGALSIHQAHGRENQIWTLSSTYNPWTSRPVETAANHPFSELSGFPEISRTDYAPNCTMVPRSVFDEVGGFDESFGMMYEEADFGLRIIKRGHRGFITIRAQTDHHGFVDPGCNSKLRLLGIERPLRTYCFARNRLRFARKHFNFLQILSVTFVFAPLSCAYYCAVALRNRRPDIAWAYFRGTLAGMIGL